MFSNAEWFAKGHMEAGYACPFQQWHENRQFFFYKVTKLKLFL